MNTELIDHIAATIAMHELTNPGEEVAVCRCLWSGLPEQHRRHLASQLMAPALAMTAQIHGEHLVREKQRHGEKVALQMTNRVEALCRLLTSEGHITPEGARQVRYVMRDPVPALGG